MRVAAEVVEVTVAAEVAAGEPAEGVEAAAETAAAEMAGAEAAETRRQAPIRRRRKPSRRLRPLQPQRPGGWEVMAEVLSSDNLGEAPHSGV